MNVVVGAGNRAPVRMGTVYPGFDQVLASVRTDVAGWIRRQGCSSGMAKRAELVISELASNAIQAASGAPFEVVVEVDGSAEVTVTVTNHTPGPAPPPRPAWRPSSPLAARGRGLAIVDAVADDVIVDRSRSGQVTVVARMYEPTR